MSPGSCTDNSVRPGMPAMTPADATAIATCLSMARISTYTAACTPAADEDPTVAALRLYHWNIEMCAAFTVPIHLCEVAIRNAVSEALTSVYGSRWPWARGFMQALPKPTHGYSPARDLAQAAASQPSTGKVIPELKFVFWEKMFTSRHDKRLWTEHLHRVLPYVDRTKPISLVRNDIRIGLDNVRTLRNRIAHHEPIFGRPLADDLAATRTLIAYRSPQLNDWLNSIENVSTLIADRP